MPTLPPDSIYSNNATKVEIYVRKYIYTCLKQLVACTTHDELYINKMSILSSKQRQKTLNVKKLEAS